MNKFQSLRITIAIDKIVEDLNMLKNAVEMLVTAEEPKLPADKVKTESVPPAPETKPVQLQLPLPPVTINCATHRRVGDVGYENEVNPARQACGQLGGLATAGIKRPPAARLRHGQEHVGEREAPLLALVQVPRGTALSRRRAGVVGRMGRDRRRQLVRDAVRQKRTAGRKAWPSFLIIKA